MLFWYVWFHLLSIFWFDLVLCTEYSTDVAMIFIDCICICIRICIWHYKIDTLIYEHRQIDRYVIISKCQNMDLVYLVLKCDPDIPRKPRKYKGAEILTRCVSRFTDLHTEDILVYFHIQILLLCETASDLEVLSDSLFIGLPVSLLFCTLLGWAEFGYSIRLEPTELR